MSGFNRFFKLKLNKNQNLIIFIITTPIKISIKIKIMKFSEICNYYFLLFDVSEDKISLLKGFLATRRKQWLQDEKIMKPVVVKPGGERCNASWEWRGRGR